MTITQQREHHSLIVRQEGFEAFMIKIKNKYINTIAMKKAIQKVN